jgi:hypothetical protein
MADLSFSDLIESKPLDFSDLVDPRKMKSINDFDTEKDPTESMSGWDLFKRGAGASVGNLYLGAKQRLGIGDQEALQDLVDVAKKKEQQIVRHPSGMAGAITGMGAVTAPTAFIPGANGIVGSAITGGLLGAATPTNEGESPASNAAFGAFTGAAGPYVARAGKGLWDAAVRPFSESGRQQMIGELLRESAGSKYLDDAIEAAKGAKSIVPGSVPTLAEATGNRGLAQVQKAVRNMPGEISTDLVNREMDNALARRGAIQGIAKTPADLDSAKQFRNGVADMYYRQSGKAMIPEDEVLSELLSRPSLKNALSKAQDLAKERGETLTFGSNTPAKTVSTGLLDETGNAITREEPGSIAVHSGKGLQYLKMGIDDLIKEGEQNGIGSHQKQALLDTKADLLNWLEDANPAYIKANRVYSQLSRPVNQMQVGQALADSLTPPLARGSSLARETGNNFARALDNAPSIISKNTGLKDSSLDKVMTRRQMETINNVRDDLARSALADDLMKAKGSDTAQNILADNFTRNGLGVFGLSGGPAKWLANTTAGSFLPRVASNVVGKPLEQKLKGLLADAILDPKMASLLMENATPRYNSKIPYALNSSIPAFGLLMKDASE